MENLQQYPDYAKRMANEVSLHAFAGSAGKWAVFALQDGSPASHMAYDNRADAVRDMKWDRDRFLYILIPPDGMHPKEAKAVIDYSRQVYDSGFRIPDPEFTEVMPTMPLMKSDWAKQIKYLNKKD
jgi:hypothetical protein